MTIEELVQLHGMMRKFREEEFEDDISSADTGYSKCVEIERLINGSAMRILWDDKTDRADAWDEWSRLTGMD